MVHHNITSYFSLVFPDIHECATIFGAYFRFSTLYFFSKAPSRETGLIHIALSTMDQATQFVSAYHLLQLFSA